MHSLLKLIVISIFISGCVTTPKKQKKLISKAEDRTESKRVKKTKRQEIPRPSDEQLFEFFTTHQSYDSKFGEDEHQFISSLQRSPKAGSLAEAVLILGLAKTILHPLNTESSTFEESDISGDTDQDYSASENKHTGLSLEKLSNERGVNIADGLLENPYLYGYGVARQVYEAAKKSTNSVDWTDEVTSALNQHALAWSILAREMGVIPDGNTEEVPQNTETTEPVNVAPNPADLVSGDTLIVEAQKLVDQGKYEEAIKRVEMIDDSSPMYNVAVEKIKDFSDRAVQKLRRKAAQAYQSAMPVADKKIRLGYLTQARDYLEQAIEGFPAATQLPRVRDNLRVISRDLAKLQEDIEQN